MTQTDNSALVSTAWLSERLGSPNVHVIEVSSANDDASYREAHVPGAHWWFWKGALWHETDRTFAAPEALAEQLGRMGVGPDATIVLYGEPVQFGTYAYWVLKMAGFTNLKLLDGAKKKWIADGMPVSSEAPGAVAVDHPAPGEAEVLSVGRDDIRTKLGDPGRVLLDVRSPEEYRGERVMPPPGFDHGAERAGRIPGSVHLFFRELLNEDDTYKSTEEVAEILSGAGAAPDDEIELVLY